MKVVNHEGQAFTQEQLVALPMATLKTMLAAAGGPKSPKDRATAAARLIQLVGVDPTPTKEPKPKADIFGRRKFRVLNLDPGVVQGWVPKQGRTVADLVAGLAADAPDHIVTGAEVRQLLEDNQGSIFDENRPHNHDVQRVFQDNFARMNRAGFIERVEA